MVREKVALTWPLVQEDNLISNVEDSLDVVTGSKEQVELNDGSFTCR